MEEVELPLDGVGARLLRARETAGLSRTQVAGMTRIPERHLAAIEAGNFGALPARTYAVGFSRNYAKAVGADQDEIAELVRAELAAQELDEPRRPIQTFEPGDPARVPGPRLVWVALIGIVAIIAAGLVFARQLFAPGGELPPVQAEETAAPAEATGAPAAPETGPVVFTALEPKVWVKFSDASGNQLMQKEMAQGETWTVPDGQDGVTIWTARPDALAITVGGQQVPKLSDVQKTVKDVPVTAAALLARGAEPAATASAAPQPAATQGRSNATPARQPQRRPAAQPSATSAGTAPTAVPAAPPAETGPAAPGPAAPAT